MTGGGQSSVLWRLEERGRHLEDANYKVQTPSTLSEEASGLDSLACSRGHSDLGTSVSKILHAAP